MNKWVESLFKEIIYENLPNLGRNLDLQVHESNRLPSISMQKDLLQDTLNETVQNKK